MIWCRARPLIINFSKWRDDGTWEKISQQLGQLERKDAGRDPKPTASIADSQPVSSTKRGPERGYDAGKRTDGRKRHLLIDTVGLVLAVLVTGADMHDADAARTLMDDHRDALERVELIWGDSKHGQKELPEWVSEEMDAEIEVKQHPDDADGFEVIERRWVVERTNAWNMNDRRLQ
jgi:transposase